MILGQLGRAASSAEQDCGFVVALLRNTLQLAQGLLEAHVFDGVFDGVSMPVPFSATMVAYKPSTTESMAALPWRVAETRSKADGTLPRWM